MKKSYVLVALSLLTVLTVVGQKKKILHFKTSKTAFKQISGYVIANKNNEFNHPQKT